MRMFRALLAIAFLLGAGASHAQVKPACRLSEIFAELSTPPGEADIPAAMKTEYFALIEAAYYPKEEVRAAAAYLARTHALSAQQKAFLWRAFSDQMSAKYPKNWRMFSHQTADQAYFFMGKEDEILIIRDDGTVYRGHLKLTEFPTYETPREFLIYVHSDWKPSTWTPDYVKLRQVR